MENMRAWLSETREGWRQLRSREFWDGFRAYWSPDAVAKRIEAFIERMGPPR